MDETQIDIRALIGLLRRQIRQIVVALVLVVGVTALVVFSLTPVYTASTLILVDPRNKNVLDPDTQAFGSASDSARVDSEVEILRSESTFVSVIRDEDIVSDLEFGVSSGFQDWIATIFGAAVATPDGEALVQDVISRFRGAVRVQRRGLTYIIDVSVSSTDPEKAARLANAVGAAYIRDQIQAKIDNTIAARNVLQVRIIEATRAVSESEQALDDYVFQNIDRIVEATGRVEIATLRDHLNSLDDERARGQQLAQIVSEAMGQEDWASIAESLQADALQELERQRQELQAQLAALDEGAPAAIDLRAELANVTEALDRAASEELSALRTSISQSQSESSELRQQIRTAALSADLPTDLLTEVFRLQQEAEVARSQYQTVLLRLRDIEAQADLQLADSRIVSPARSPSSPSFPNKSLVLSLAGLLGVGLGLGLAFLREYYVGGFSSESQVESVLKVPVAASLPVYRRSGNDNTETSTPADAMITSPLSMYAESVRRVRAAVDQEIRSLSQNVDGKAAAIGSVAMVCSAVPGEGKSTLSLSLGRAYALSGKKVLLIDTDMRKPSVHSQLGLEPSSGLYDYLASGGSETVLSDIVSREPHSSMAVIVGARRSDLPTDQLLISKAFANLVELGKKTFDIVILDTPPIRPVVDCLYLAPYADVLVLVVQWATTSQDDAKYALKSLESAKRPQSPIIAVLDQVERNEASYRGRYYAYYREAR